MNELKVFDFEQQNIRTIAIENEPYFVGKDVAEVLGYKNHSRDVNRHVDEEDRITQNLPQYQNGTLVSKTTLINESGLYSLIFGSKLESAKRFKRWVTSEVLPQIRQSGFYVTKQSAEEMLNNPEILQMFVDHLAKLNSTQLEFQNKTQDELKYIKQTLTGEYVTPQDLLAIKFATTSKAEKVVDSSGLQVSLDDFLTEDIYELAQINKREKQQRKHDVGRVKSRIIVLVKKHLGMKGNAPNNHIKRKDVDRAVQFIQDVRSVELQI